MKISIRYSLVLLVQVCVLGLNNAQEEREWPAPDKSSKTIDSGTPVGSGLFVPVPNDSTSVLIDPDDVEMSSRGGARVSVYLHDGTMVFGDLMAVGDCLLTVYAYRDLSLVYDRSLNSGRHNIEFRDIDRIIVKGRSRMLQGIFIGFLGGMLTGSIVGRASKIQSPTSDLTGPGGLGGIGLVIGGTVGWMNSGSDIEMASFGERELTQLKSLCGRAGKRTH